MTITDWPSTGVLVWWVSLTTISALNVAAWIMVARGFARQTRSLDRRQRATRRAQLVLSALFVSGCAFRSLLPLAEGQRFCLFHSWISAAVISRSVATVAELALITQWTLLLREYARGVGAKPAFILSHFPVPLIATAEVFSWYTALTTNFIGSVVEESTWALTAAVMIISFSLIWPRYHGTRRKVLSVVIALTAVYFVFMCSVDVPMYRQRRRADQMLGKRYLSLADGWRDASTRRVVTRAWSDWRDEMPWMSLYFTAGVWISLALVRSPPCRDAESADAERRPARPPIPGSGGGGDDDVRDSGAGQSIAGRSSV